MIDIATLRALGSLESNASAEVLREACWQAADTIEDLCNQLDGCVRVAADALKRVKENQ